YGDGPHINSGTGVATVYAITHIPLTGGGNVAFGGYFNRVGGVNVHNFAIRKTSNGTWITNTGGISKQSSDARIHALAYADLHGNLVLGGDFDRAAVTDDDAGSASNNLAIYNSADDTWTFFPTGITRDGSADAATVRVVLASSKISLD